MLFFIDVYLSLPLHNNSLLLGKFIFVIFDIYSAGTVKVIQTFYQSEGRDQRESCGLLKGAERQLSLL